MNIIQELNKTKNKIGLVRGRLRVNEYEDADQNVSAHITPSTWDVEINLKKGFNPIKDRRQKAYARKKKIENGLETMLRSVSYHEFAHWELPFGSGLGCPYDTYNHDLILEAVKQALPEQKKSHASYVTNAFEDLIINPRCKEYDDKERFAGQILFWDDQGIQSREKGLESYTQMYEAFVKLNMHLFGDNVDKALLKRHYSNEKKVDDAVKKVIQDLRLEESIKDTSVLFRKSQWPLMASKFASAMIPLLEESPEEKLSAYSSNDGAGNGVEQESLSKEGKEDISYGRYKSNQAQSPNITSYEQLDSLYRRLAKAIPVKVESKTREHSMNLGPLNYRAFNPEKDHPSRITPSRLFAGDERIEFGHPKDRIVIDVNSKVQSTSFPDFKLVLLDNSGSMKEGLNGSQGNTRFIPWGDNSKYHHALLGFYGIENYLQKNGIAQYIGHGMGLFSSTTRYKEAGFNDIKKLRELALSPEFGNTKLDSGTLLRSLNGRDSFVLSISDGEIEDWSNSRTKFFEL
ncbi:MAG: hypothetical protein AABY15_04320, partial [Nanoarchaeota archaeon]